MVFYFVTTDHLEINLWFRDEQDFKACMNSVAIVSFLCGVNILAFILMSNHVHFVLECTYDEAVRFITALKKRHAQYLSGRYGVRKPFRRNGVDIREVSPQDESLERSIAYVQMNSVAANICANPFDYQWGTGNTFFRNTAQTGQRLDGMSMRAVERCVSGRTKLPGDYLMRPDGYIDPCSYVKVSFVEAVFRTPKRYLMFLNGSSKAKKTLSSERSIPVFRDHVLIPAVKEIVYSLYRAQSIKELDYEKQAEVIRQIRRRFSADIHQISRVTGIGMDQVTHLLEDFI